MRAVLIGEVVEVKDASWTNQQGQVQEQFEAFIRQDGSSLAYGADRVVLAKDVQVEQGQKVALVVNFRAKTYRSGAKAGEAFLSAFAVGHYTQAAAKAA
jgi:hypothetical protein